jgi:predicted Zn-dependent protease
VIEALYFDGRSARGQPVQLRIEGDELVADGETPRRWPLADATWPERTRHGQRVVQLRGGGALQAADAAAFDHWRQAAGGHESWVVRAQQNWRAALAAALLLVSLAAAGYLWGVPLASRVVLVAVPHRVDAAWGEAALAQLDGRWLQPSALPEARQRALRREFAELVTSGFPANDAPAWQLHFRAADQRIGANAFALPAGHIVVTDALVQKLEGHDDTLLGVLAHELGHVRHRHGMQSLVQAALIGAATGVVIGDFSSLLAGGAALLGEMGYSRDAERAADTEAVRLLRASGRSPAVMVVLFDKLRADPAHAAGGPVALASHPVDEERVRYFLDASRGLTD